jgi:hypothetical protein
MNTNRLNWFKNNAARELGRIGDAGQETAKEFVWRGLERNNNLAGPVTAI